MVFILLGALLIGLTLGMLGSGGSAITVPVLVYLVGHSGKVSIAESMAIVGLISVAAAIPYGRSHQIDWRSVLYFGIPGMFGTYIGAYIGGLASEVVQLVVFGVVLLFAAYTMLRQKNPVSSPKEFSDDMTATTDSELAIPKSPTWKVAAEGMTVGILTGFVGVGGGFLIIPALVILIGLPMRIAIGTSLVIIAANSIVGFAKYQQYLYQHELSVDMETIATFTVVGILGSFIGRAINKQLNQIALRRAFAIMLILLGGFVIYREGIKYFLPQSSDTVVVVQLP